MRYFIANWKANKNLEETKTWVNHFFTHLDHDEKTTGKLNNDLIKVIICPPFPLLYPLKELLHDRKNIRVGCQDVSGIDGGTFTGEVPTYSLVGIAEYAIIGHSERKKYLHETVDDIMKKITLSQQNRIEPIYCAANAEATLPQKLTFFCYEPPDAISVGDGKGNNVSSAEIIEVRNQIKLPKNVKFIYGGSVNKDNVGEYLQHEEIDGFLSGGASLDPHHFYQMIIQA